MVRHNKLLHKLHGYGIYDLFCRRGPLKLGLVNRYRRGRRAALFQRAFPKSVFWGRCSSSYMLMDLSDNLSDMCELFADDLKIYLPLVDPAIDFYQLTNDLNIFSAWSSVWHLDVSREKCHVLHVNSQRECMLR